jgi:hypothetical protein
VVVVDRYGDRRQHLVAGPVRRFGVLLEGNRTDLMAPTDARSFDRYFVRATNKLNIQIATEGGTRISVSPHEKSETKSITFSPVINGADSPNRRNGRAQRHRRVRVQLQPVAHLVDCGTHEDGKLLATSKGTPAGSTAQCLRPTVDRHSPGLGRHAGARSAVLVVLGLGSDAETARALRAPAGQAPRRHSYEDVRRSLNSTPGCRIFVGATTLQSGAAVDEAESPR